MKSRVVTIMGGIAIGTLWAATGWTQPMCPPEVASAKAMLSRMDPRPDELAGQRSQDLQAPRNQDVQAPRSRSPYATPADPAKKTAATALVREADAACAQGDIRTATEKAVAAIDIMKQ